MCGLPAVGLGFSLLSGGLSAYSSIQQGNAGYMQGMYNAAIAEQNAKLALEQKDTIKEQGSLDRRRLGEETRGIKGEIRASAAASGLDPDWGSPAGAQEDVNQAYRIDRSIINKNETANLRAVDLDA